MACFENFTKMKITRKRLGRSELPPLRRWESTLRQTAKHPVTLRAVSQPGPATLYFFHFRSNEIYSRDDEGAFFTSLSEAYDDALSSAREMIAQKLLTYVAVPWESVIEIVGEDGVVLDVVTFREAAGLA
jgi:hypothetical protein